MFYCLLISLRLTFLYKNKNRKKQKLKMANTKNHKKLSKSSANILNFLAIVPTFTSSPPPLSLYKYYYYIVSLRVFSFSTISIQPPTLFQHIASCIKRERAQPPVCSKYFLIVNNLTHRFFWCVLRRNVKHKTKNKRKEKKKKRKTQTKNLIKLQLILFKYNNVITVTKIID